MRKIETLMNAAIANGRNWKLDNTAVIQREDGITEVRLYDKKIAELGDFFVTLYDGGFRSKTTKSRLNAILSENGCDNDKVFQKNHKWFLSNNGEVEKFTSGVTLR
jgi:hypothetical protein